MLWESFHPYGSRPGLEAATQGCLLWMLSVALSALSSQVFVYFGSKARDQIYLCWLLHLSGHVLLVLTGRDLFLVFWVWLGQMLTEEEKGPSSETSYLRHCQGSIAVFWLLVKMPWKNPMSSLLRGYPFNKTIIPHHSLCFHRTVIFRLLSFLLNPHFQPAITLVTLWIASYSSHSSMATACPEPNPASPGSAGKEIPTAHTTFYWSNPLWLLISLSVILNSTLSSVSLNTSSIFFFSSSCWLILGQMQLDIYLNCLIVYGFLLPLLSR